ncbi:unnamed protein product [Bursaphelenchus xylophilus]|uniref:(pine wood nematode) hypothetical protein n=1 Tax=Bursaphelenchus xylophilus TaxID=6326 RepID=A0A1I7SL94_BURXY|nr:unnamed protein product [Bursaphelenchus xylophilus]CAG9129427.1 unnamed protein product [Bursaphelenchus xylophilus]
MIRQVFFIVLCVFGCSCYVREVYLDLFFKCKGEPVRNLSVELYQNSSYSWHTYSAMNKTSTKGFLHLESWGWSVLELPHFFMIFRNPCCKNGNPYVKAFIRPVFTARRKIVELETKCTNISKDLEIEY